MVPRALSLGLTAVFVQFVFLGIAVLTMTSAYSCYSTGAVVGSGTVENGTCLSAAKEVAYIVFGLGTLSSSVLLYMGLRQPRTEPAPTPS